MNRLRGVRRGLLSALLALSAALVLAVSSDAVRTALPQQSGTVDLLTQANVVLPGVGRGDRAGTSVAGAGDVNGDGRGDVIVGAPRSGNNGRFASGSAYVVFGREEPGEVSLAALGDDGFRIDGAAAVNFAGDSVAGAGDVNGDGRADLLVGAPSADYNARESSGSAYVVFGKASATNVDLAALADQGFRIDGAAADDRAGVSVAGAGDVNGDTRPDLIVGALYAGNNQRGTSGSAYVVFGKASPGNVDLAALGDEGFRIDGAAARDLIGFALAGARDVNGDGYGDVVVGSPVASHARQYSGSAYVVFGKASTSTVDLAALGDRGFKIDGAAGDFAGDSLAGAGDVNGDGRSDLLVGAPLARSNAREYSGSAYVVFGKASPETVDLAALGDQGFRIDGAAAWDQVGESVAGAGDLNGDGRADLVVGAPDASNAYVVFGKAPATSVDLAALGDQGFRMRGAGWAGASVAGAGDVNGDSREDVLVGAPLFPGFGGDVGAAYVVYGFGKPELAYDQLTAAAGLPVAPHAPILVRRTGTARFAVARPLPAGLRLDPKNGVVSGTPRAQASQRTYTVTMTDLAGTADAPLVLTVTPDRTRPQLALGGRSPQRALRRQGVAVSARCDEACALRATGTIAVGARRTRIGLQPSRAGLAVGTRRLVLRLAPAAQGRLADLLARGKRARAIVTVRAVDRFGNASTARRTIALIP